MKIRAGFVSNSSSSSFCVIGTEVTNYVNELLEAEFGMRWEDMNWCKKEDLLRSGDYGQVIGKCLNYYVNSDELNYAGISTDCLETMTLPQAREHFASLVREKLGVTVPIDSIDLVYGESGNE